MQSVLSLQPVHSAPSQPAAVHVWVRTAGHAPDPSHVSSRVDVPEAHDGARQRTFSPGIAQAVVSAPLHTPSHPVPLPSQRGLPAAGAPATGEQVPALPATAHDSHCPVHAELQHTPSTQNEERHCSSPEHACPGVPLARHFPSVVQKLPAMHSLADAQLLRHPFP